MSELEPAAADFEQTYRRIAGILAEARGRAYQAINRAMVLAYWEIGRAIVEVEQGGAARADYGKRLLLDLSRRLTQDFGKGFDRTNLQQMRVFYLTYPKCDALRHELSWTHYRILLRVEKPEARSFYENEAVNARWSTRELERQIHALLFERLALSRDKQHVLALARQGQVIESPADLIKDPYVLEHLPQAANAKRVADSITLPPSCLRLRVARLNRNVDRSAAGLRWEPGSRSVCSWAHVRLRPGLGPAAAAPAPASAAALGRRRPGT